MLWKAILTNAAFKIGSEAATELAITDPVALLFFSHLQFTLQCLKLLTAACQQTVIHNLIHIALSTVTITNISRIAFIEQLSVEGLRCAAKA